MSHIRQKSIVIPFRARCKALLAILLALALAACATQEPPLPEGVGTFVGKVNDNLFIAVTAAEHPGEGLERVFMVYLCDGADRSTWLVVESEGTAATLENGDVGVNISSTGATVSGQVQTAGEAPQAFTAELATGDAGLYRVQRVGPPPYTGGWIILNNLEQRGALTKNATVIENPVLDTSTGTAITSAGIFSDVTRLPCIPTPTPFGCIPVPQVQR